MINNSSIRAYLIKQSQENNIVKTNTLAPQNKYDQLNVITTENKKIIILHTDPVLPISIFQNILALNLFSKASVIICLRLGSLQMQYFANKRAPPIL
ncbi:hypothetical protein GCM10023260_14280 [Bartonella acomydis]|uniref:Uncharacterized protein n=2 Tax=Bartonella acomydis TaxID=686234 RepID=A0ABP9MXC4_9HYPH